MIVIIMILLFIIFARFCIKQFFTRIKKSMIKKDIKISAKCEKCGTEYDITPDEFMSLSTIKHGKKYKYSKKLNCPVCNSKEYAELTNMNDLNKEIKNPIVQRAILWMSIMIIGFIGIYMIGNIIVREGQKQRCLEICPNMECITENCCESCNY